MLLTIKSTYILLTLLTISPISADSAPSYISGLPYK